MIGFYLFLALEKFLMLLPHSWRKALFTGLAKLAYIIDKKHRLVIKQNLQFIYGDDVDASLVEEVSRYAYKNLALNVLFTIERRYLSLQELKEKVTFENIEHAEKVLAEGRPVIYTAAHFGQWEVGGSAIGAFVEPLVVIYKVMSNPHFEKYLLESRGKFGITNVAHHGALKPLIKQLRKKGSIALLGDTKTSERDGVSVDFLGKPTTQVTTPAVLARKLDAAIIPVISYTDDNENYVVKFFEEIEVSKTDDEDIAVQKATQGLADWLTKAVYDDPKQWFWLHRRWKSDYPEIYETKS